MGRAYVTGLGLALRRWSLILLLFAASVAGAVGFTVAAWYWLALAFHASLATRALLTNLDMNVFVDLFAHHEESLGMLGLNAVVLAVPCVLLGIWLDAVTVVNVSEDARLGDCLRRGFGLYPTYLQLWLFAAVLDVLALGAAYLVGHGLARWTAESANEFAFTRSVAAGAVVGALLLLFTTTVHDHARVRSVASGAGAVRAFVWALAYVGRREWQALPLAVLLLGSGAVAWLGYQLVAHLIATSSATGVTLSLLWGEVLLLCRMLLRVWSFAAETTLQGLSEHLPG
jgi:hypothetical protein